MSAIVEEAGPPKKPSLSSIDSAETVTAKTPEPVPKTAPKSPKTWVGGSQSKLAPIITGPARPQSPPSPIDSQSPSPKREPGSPLLPELPDLPDLPALPDLPSPLQSPIVPSGPQSPQLDPEAVEKLSFEVQRILNRAREQMEMSYYHPGAPSPPMETEVLRTEDHEVREGRDRRPLTESSHEHPNDWSTGPRSYADNIQGVDNYNLSHHYGNPSNPPNPPNLPTRSHSNSAPDDDWQTIPDSVESVSSSVQPSPDISPVHTNDHYNDIPESLLERPKGHRMSIATSLAARSSMLSDYSPIVSQAATVEVLTSQGPTTIDDPAALAHHESVAPPLGPASSSHETLGADAVPGHDTAILQKARDTNRDLTGILHGLRSLRRSTSGQTSDPETQAREIQGGSNDTEWDFGQHEIDRVTSGGSSRAASGTYGPASSHSPSTQSPRLGYPKSGSPQASQKPNLVSPNIGPNLGSPNLGSPNPGSNHGQGQGPQYGAGAPAPPKYGSPKYGSPALDSPKYGTPKLGAPAVANFNRDAVPKIATPDPGTGSHRSSARHSKSNSLPNVWTTHTATAPLTLSPGKRSIHSRNTSTSSRVSSKLASPVPEDQWAPEPGADTQWPESGSSARDSVNLPDRLSFASSSSSAPESDIHLMMSDLDKYRTRLNELSEDGSSAGENRLSNLSGISGSTDLSTTGSNRARTAPSSPFLAQSLGTPPSTQPPVPPRPNSAYSRTSWKPTATTLPEETMLDLAAPSVAFERPPSSMSSQESFQTARNASSREHSQDRGQPRHDSTGSGGISDTRHHLADHEVSDRGGVAPGQPFSSPNAGDGHDEDQTTPIAIKPHASFSGIPPSMSSSFEASEGDSSHSSSQTITQALNDSSRGIDPGSATGISGGLSRGPSSSSQQSKPKELANRDTLVPGAQGTVNARSDRNTLIAGAVAGAAALAAAGAGAGARAGEPRAKGTGPEAEAGNVVGTGASGTAEPAEAEVPTLDSLRSLKRDSIRDSGKRNSLRDSLRASKAKRNSFQAEDQDTDLLRESALRQELEDRSGQSRVARGPQSPIESPPLAESSWLPEKRNKHYSLSSGPRVASFQHNPEEFRPQDPQQKEAAAAAAEAEAEERRKSKRKGKRASRHHRSQSAITGSDLPPRPRTDRSASGPGGVSKVPFKEGEVQKLLDLSDRYSLDKVDLPPDERHLLEKFIDALSKLSVEINLDESKKVEGKRRLQNALRAIEGWI